MAFGSPPPVTMVGTEFTFTLPFQEPSSTSPPQTPTFGASPSRFSPPSTPFSRRTAEKRKLQPGLERKTSLFRRPKWYIFLFGSVKLPVEMETKRIRTGRTSRNPSGRVDCGYFSMELGGGGGAGKAWRLLHSLSCGAGVDVVAQNPARLVL